MTLADATILVVDDEPELLEIFAVWLSRIGCTVLTAANGVEALKVLTAQRVDALISDIRMPIMDGVTLVRRLNELKVFVPSIIFVSGFGDVDVREMYSLGVEAMLAKPLSRQQLLHALESSLKERTELWTEPLVGLVKQAVEMTFDSLENAHASSAFAIGRGGCCLQTQTPLTEDLPVQLSLHFTLAHLHLEAQGMVRWYRPKEQRVGVEFSYLAPASRTWVLASMHGNMLFSFIPRC
jgi:CheY-like chemotaxis protein